MPTLIDETPEASAWIERVLAEQMARPRSGKLSSGVLWTDGYLGDGEPIGGDDPSKLVNEINERGLQILRGHDPGFPVGQTLAAQEFRSPGGIRFVAAIFCDLRTG